VQGSILCPSCGEYLILDLDLKAVQRISLIAKMPALIPGIFNIFGLGHLIIGKYLRAFILLLISLVLRVVNRILVLSGVFPYGSNVPFCESYRFCVSALGRIHNNRRLDG